MPNSIMSCSQTSLCLPICPTLLTLIFFRFVPRFPVICRRVRFPRFPARLFLDSPTGKPPPHSSIVPVCFVTVIPPHTDTQSHPDGPLFSPSFSPGVTEPNPQMCSGFLLPFLCEDDLPVSIPPDPRSPIPSQVLFFVHLHLWKNPAFLKSPRTPFVPSCFYRVFIVAWSLTSLD